MSPRKKEFDTGQAGDYLTLYHGTRSEDEESYRTHGIDVGRAVADEGKIWATALPTHSPRHWVHGAGWGPEYKQPTWNRVIEFKVPRTDAELVHPRVQNYQLSRSVRPDEIVQIHNPHQRYAKRIARAKELEAQRWAELRKQR